MIKKIIRAILSGMFFTKAVSLVAKNKYEDALFYLNKSDKYGDIYSHYLLRGHILFVMRDFNGCIESMEKSKNKVLVKRSLNSDERLYLMAYADDLINSSIVHGRYSRNILDVNREFTIENVESRIKENFPLLTK